MIKQQQENNYTLSNFLMVITYTQYPVFQNKMSLLCLAITLTYMNWF